MKKLVMLIVALALLISSCFSFVGCTDNTTDEGDKEIKEEQQDAPIVEL